MCLKRFSPGEIYVPLSRLHAVEARSLTKTKVVQRMTKLLQIGVESGAMSNDWTKQAQSLIDQAESVNPEVLMIDYDPIDGTKEEWKEALNG